MVTTVEWMKSPKRTWVRFPDSDLGAEDCSWTDRMFTPDFSCPITRVEATRRAEEGLCNWYQKWFHPDACRLIEAGMTDTVGADCRGVDASECIKRVEAGQAIVNVNTSRTGARTEVVLETFWKKTKWFFIFGGIGAGLFLLAREFRR